MTEQQLIRYITELHKQEYPKDTIKTVIDLFN